MTIHIKEQDIVQAAQECSASFVELFVNRTLEAIGGELNADTMPQLTTDQITLLAYWSVRRELMEGGFVQLIHNGYGPFVFQNPFAKVIRMWGARDFSKLIYEASHRSKECIDALTADCSDEEFMALYEQFPQFDELDDDFVEMEEDVTDIVAHYIDEHIGDFAEVEVS